ncbi:hypothetical protein MRX96_039324 [Rhipicephalus microplus]
MPDPISSERPCISESSRPLGMTSHDQQSSWQPLIGEPHSRPEPQRVRRASHGSVPRRRRRKAAAVAADSREVFRRLRPRAD